MSNTNETKKTTTTTKSSSKRVTIRFTLTLKMFAFWTLVSAAVLYLVAMILSLCNVVSVAVMALQNVAMAAMVVTVAILAWRYVTGRSIVYKLLYFIALALVVVGIIIPLI